MTNTLTKDDDFIIETVIRTNNMRGRGSGFGQGSETTDIVKHDTSQLSDKIIL